jgi:hypothetical protein
VLISKFTEGAWIPTIVIPVVVVVCSLIKRHYNQVEEQLAVSAGEKLPVVRNNVVVLVSRIDRNVVDALAYAKSLHPERLVALSVEVDDSGIDGLRERWAGLNSGVTLEVVASPYREVTAPILDFIERLDAQRTGDVITVIIPEVVVHRWSEQFLHNQTAVALKARLLFRPNTVVISVPAQFD